MYASTCIGWMNVVPSYQKDSTLLLKDNKEGDDDVVKTQGNCCSRSWYCYFYCTIGLVRWAFKTFILCKKPIVVEQIINKKITTDYAKTSLYRTDMILQEEWWEKVMKDNAQSTYGMQVYR
jgi:hypothetical protein